jgi:hypothetical protein
MVDWNGEWDFSDSLPRNKTTGEVHTHMKPVPKPIPEAQEALNEYEIYMKPPSKADFMGLMARLVIHTIDKNQEPQEFGLRMLDYYDDLKEYPASLLNDACTKWRSRKESPLYFPTIGQLSELMHYPFHDAKKIHKRLKVLAGKDTKDVQKEQVNDRMKQLLQKMRG